MEVRREFFKGTFEGLILDFRCTGGHSDLKLARIQEGNTPAVDDINKYHKVVQ